MVDQKYKVLLIDFYDVIHVDPYQKWLNDHGIKRQGVWHDITIQYDRGSISSEEFLQTISSNSGESIEDIRSCFINSRQVDMDVVELVRSLKPNYSTALVSNAGGPNVRQRIKENNIEDLFDELIISGECGFIKPEPQIFELSLTKLGAEPEESIFIDDNPKNVQGALDVGITGIVFKGVKELRERLHQLKVLAS